MKRRSFIKLLGSLGVVAVAGCRKPEPEFMSDVVLPDATLDEFIKARDVLDNANVPVEGRIAFYESFRIIESPHLGPSFASRPDVIRAQSKKNTEYRAFLNKINSASRHV